MKAGLRHRILFVIVSMIGSLYAQNPVFRTIGTEDGLPSSEVYSVVQDDRGYIWGATDRGLFCYNGKSTRVYTIRDGLPTNVVYKMFKAPKGRIWFAASNNHIAYVENDKIHTVPANREIERLTEFRQHEIASMDYDEQGNVVIGTYGAGIIRVLAGTYRELKQDNSYVGMIIEQLGSHSYSISVPMSARDMKFIQQVSYPLKLKVKSGDKTRYHEIEVLKEDLKGTKRLMAVKDAGGCIRAVYNSALLSLYPDGSITKVCVEDPLLFIKRDRKGGLWIGYLNKGVKYYPSGDMEREAKVYFDGFSITDIETDREGGVWCSTLESGLLYVPNSALLEHSVGVDGIRGLNVAGNSLYGLSQGGDLFRIGNEGSTTQSHFERGTLVNRVSFMEWKEEVYLCSSGTMAIDENLQVVRHIKDRGRDLISKSFCTVGKDKLLFAMGYEFLLTYENGILADEIPIASSANTIKQLKSGEIWIGTSAGIYKYSDRKTYRIFTDLPQLETRITEIDEERKWRTAAITTLGHGVSFIRNGQCVTISEADGLISDLCNSVVFRNEREAWVATNHGVSRIRWKNKDLENYSISNYTSEHGLRSNEVEFIELFTDKIWIGTKKGLFSLDVNVDLKNTVPPTIHLVNCKIGDDVISMSSDVKLDYTQNSLSFQFDVLSFRNPLKNGIAYRIVGEDEEFISIAGDLLTLNNLAPGIYEVEVFGVNSDGEASEEPLLLHFEILPPFYGTWWFNCLEGLGFILLMYLLLRWRFMVQRRRDFERLRIERQLSSSQLTAIRSQMNPHFIFNAFNGIQRYVLQKDKMDTYRYVSKFSTLIREVLEQSSQNYISIQKEVDMLRNYVEIESLRFDNKFSFELEVNVPASLMEYEIPTMIVQPFVENAIWHGLMPLDARDGELILRFTLRNNFLLIEVIDNGIGRDQSAQIKKGAKTSSMGIRLIDERIHLVNTLQPNEPVNYQIMDLKDIDGSTTGTKVSIHIKIMREE